MESGIYHTTYQQDMAFRHTPIQYGRLILVLALALVFPLAFQGNEYYLLLANQCLVAAIGAIGLNLLVGFTGQISLGQGAFLAVGAYTAGTLITHFGIAWFIAIPLAALFTAVIGMMFGIPSLRLKGLYLAIATLAAQQIVDWFVTHFNFNKLTLSGESGALSLPSPRLFGVRLNTNFDFYWVILICLILTVIAVSNLLRTRYGRAFRAIRDQDIAAEVMGIDPFKTKLLAFAVSSFFVGLEGALMANTNTRVVTWESYTIDVSITYLAMIIIGGLGSVSGSIYGAIFMTMLPALLNSLGDTLQASGASLSVSQWLPYLKEGVFGLVIVLFLVFEPKGIVQMWRNVKDYFRLWPFSY